ncbi:hypothetical protein GQ53DRAFT_812796 [Thozetella sp. PMI_491]|nr:hypothetical protein GQ53DRAFT_812796 [Thozetella sp. PMI_491]
MPDEPPGTGSGRLPHEASRIKIRKGTTSCWECKHRKIRCRFAPDDSTICISCRRRRCECIPQDLPDPNEAPASSPDGQPTDMAHQITRLESLVASLARERARTARAGPASGPAGPARGAAHPGRRRDRPMPSRVPLPMMLDPANDYHLSRVVSSFLPTARAASIILQSGMLALPSRVPNQPGMPRSLKNLYVQSPTSPPIALAKSLLQLATSLQEMSTSAAARALGLDATINGEARRYFEVASSYVTSHDSLMLSLEGLETLVLEILYHANQSHWRFAWLSCRRALNIAQLLGLHLPQARSRSPLTAGDGSMYGSPAEFLWRLLIYVDHFLCLILCCPPVIESKETDLPVGGDRPTWIGRMHTVVMGKLIARNNAMQIDVAQGSPRSDRYEETRIIDYDMKRTARAVPATWWASPSADAADADGTKLLSQVLTHVHHNYLLILLHLPYLVPSASNSKGLTDPSRPSAAIPDYAYSKVSGARATREVLTRFVFYHRLGAFPFSSQGSGIKAFVAIVALMLAHINGQSHDLDNVLEPQRREDMLIVAEAMKTMKAVDARSDDPVSRVCLKICEKLVEIQARADAGVAFVVWMGRSPHVDPEYRFVEREDGVVLDLPYFGKVHVVASGQRADSELSRDNRLPFHLRGTPEGSIGDQEARRALPDWWPESRQRFLVSAGDLALDQSVLTPPRTHTPSTHRDSPSDVSSPAALLPPMPGAP